MWAFCLFVILCHYFFNFFPVFLLLFFSGPFQREKKYGANKYIINIDCKSFYFFFILNFENSSNCIALNDTHV